MECPYILSTILWNKFSFKECLFYFIRVQELYSTENLHLLGHRVTAPVIRDTKQGISCSSLCCKKSRNRKHNTFWTHHLTFGTGLPSSLVFMSNMSPSSTSMALSISLPNEGGIWAMIKLALVSAWPTKLDAVTLYCWNQKNYNNSFIHLLCILSIHIRSVQPKGYRTCHNSNAI